MGTIYTSGNYLIVKVGEKPNFTEYEYSMKNTGYTRNDEGGLDKFEIVESAVSSRLSGRMIILVSDILAEKWLDFEEKPFTVETLTKFLRENTAV